MLMNIDTRLTADSFETDRQHFLAYLSVKGRKDSTLRTYSEALRSVHRTMLDMGLVKSIRDLTPDDVLQIKDALSIGETSKKLYLIVVGRLQECFGLENSVKKADILWNNVEPRRLFIRPEDFKVMMASCDAREKVVLMLGAYMGLRRSEMCSICWHDLTGNILTVHGKGHGTAGKVAHLTVPRPLMMALDSWRQVRPHSVSDNILLTADGRPLPSSRIGAIVGKIAKRCGVMMTPHSLRRLFATTLYETGADLNTIRMLMRHESVNTTVNCYINVNPIVRSNALDALCVALG